MTLYDLTTADELTIRMHDGRVMRIYSRDSNQSLSIASKDGEITHYSRDGKVWQEKPPTPAELARLRQLLDGAKADITLKLEKPQNP